MPSKGSVEQAEGAVIMPNSAAAVSEASAGVFGCSEVKGQVQEENQNTETCKYIFLEWIFPASFQLINCIQVFVVALYTFILGFSVLVIYWINFALSF